MKLRELYKRGRATNVCTFVIEGKVDITVGTEEFRSQLGKFQIIARKALTSFPNDQYIPDFSAMRNFRRNVSFPSYLCSDFTLVESQ